MKYSNPWSGGRQFYKGKTKKLPTAETDKEYQAYCKRKSKKKKKKTEELSHKAKDLHYKAWCARQRRKHGMF